MASAPQVRPRSPQRGRAALVAVFVAFVPLGFSEEFLEATFEALGRSDFWIGYGRWVLLPVDLILMGVMLTIARSRRRWHPDWTVRTGWFLAGAAAMLLIDVPAVLVGMATRDHPPLWFDVLSASLYALSLAVLLAAVVGVSPWAVVRRQRAPVPRFKQAMPLLLGTYLAYLASVFWDHSLDKDAIRTLEQANAHADENLTAYGLTKSPETLSLLQSLCGGAVDQEYFAQISQIIPLLIVAVGLEAKFFAGSREMVSRAIIILTVIILCAGEAMAISALTRPNQGCGNLLSGWHEYSAFILTVEACAVALVSLVWLLLPSSEPPPRRQVAPRPRRPRGPFTPVSRRPPDDVSGVAITLSVLRRRRRRAG